MSNPSRRSTSNRGRGCKVVIDLGSQPRLESIVRVYRARAKPNSDEELGSFRKEPTVATAVKRAGLAQTRERKRYHHQRRLPRELLRVVAGKLLRAQLGKATNFDDLHARVEKAIGPLHGVGELMVYDTALRIGARLGLSPRRVFLHAGTRVGARALGLDWRAKCLSVSAFPLALRKLKPHEIEDVLCIFKDKLKSAG